MIEHSVTLAAGTIKRIHIDQHRNAANKKDGGDRPVYTIQAKGGPYKAHEVHISGPSQFLGNTDPLSCGAIHYLVTRSKVRTVVRKTYTGEHACDLLALDMILDGTTGEELNAAVEAIGAEIERVMA